MSADGYIMGRSATETERLRLQGQIYGPHTDHLLRMAGLAPGMRVLDLGCGAGDVTLQAARLVGASGEAIGVDVDADLLSVAADRAARSGMTNVSFVRAEIPDIPVHGQVDAIIGRLILIHLDDPAGAIRALRPLLRPGGIVSFQELGIGHIASARALPLVAESARWCVAALHASGHPLPDTEGIVPIFREAGMVISGIAATSPATDDPESPLYAYQGATVAALLPLIIAHGVATAAEVGIDTLVDRLRAEARGTGSVLYLPELIGVWATERG